MVISGGPREILHVCAASRSHKGTGERSYGSILAPFLRISLCGEMTRAPSPVRAPIFAIESPSAEPKETESALKH